MDEDHNLGIKDTFIVCDYIHINIGSYKGCKIGF